MSLSIHADVPPLRATKDGVVRIADTRIPLERVVRAFLAGMTPEQIVHDFDVLAVEDVYSVINYYLHHRAEVDAYLEAAEQETDAARHAMGSGGGATGLRARLLARRSNGAG
jgi:uncharacterized protein (DUF433 family)